MISLEDEVRAVLAKLSPGGALLEVAESNPELDKLQGEFSALEALVQRHLGTPTLVARLEDDFATCVPAIADAAIPLESWAIPLLSALAGPCAPLLSFGLTVAVKLALAALKAWAANRLKGKPAIS